VNSAQAARQPARSRASLFPNTSLHTPIPTLRPYTLNPNPKSQPLNPNLQTQVARRQQPADKCGGAPAVQKRTGTQRNRGFVFRTPLHRGFVFRRPFLGLRVSCSVDLYAESQPDRSLGASSRPTSAANLPRLPSSARLPWGSSGHSEASRSRSPQVLFLLFFITLEPRVE